MGDGRKGPSKNQMFKTRCFRYQLYQLSKCLLRTHVLHLHLGSRCKTICYSPDVINKAYSWYLQGNLHQMFSWQLCPSGTKNPHFEHPKCWSENVLETHIEQDDILNDDGLKWWIITKMTVIRYQNDHYLKENLTWWITFIRMLKIGSNDEEIADVPCFQIRHYSLWKVIRRPRPRSPSPLLGLNKVLDVIVKSQCHTGRTFVCCMAYAPFKFLD